MDEVEYADLFPRCIIARAGNQGAYTDATRSSQLPNLTEQLKTLLLHPHILHLASASVIYLFKMKKYSMSKVDPRILLEGVQALMNGLYCSSGLIAGTMERKDLASTVDN